MAEVNLTLDQLKEAVERMERREKYHGMTGRLTVRICQYPNGRTYFEIEQHSPYAECASSIERLSN